MSTTQKPVGQDHRETSDLAQHWSSSNIFFCFNRWAFKFNIYSYLMKLTQRWLWPPAVSPLEEFRSMFAPEEQTGTFSELQDILRSHSLHFCPTATTVILETRDILTPYNFCGNNMDYFFYIRIYTCMYISLCIARSAAGGCYLWYCQLFSSEKTEESDVLDGW